MEGYLEQITPVTRVSSDADFACFVAPHWDEMACLARRLAPPGEWEDVLQDALSSAWRKRAQFDHARGSARNWLLAVVANHAHKGFRRWRPVYELHDQPVQDGDGDADVDLRRALARLTVKQRTAVTLHYYLGLRVVDIAEVMSCGAGTVKSTLSEARARLRRELGEDYR